MKDKYTEDDLIKTTAGYAVEVELNAGKTAKIFGPSVAALLTSANELYHKQANLHNDAPEPTADHSEVTNS